MIPSLAVDIPQTVNGVAPQAIQVVDGEHYAIALDLEPMAPSLLTDIARALHADRNIWRLTALAALKPADPERVRHLDAILRSLRRNAALRPVITAPQAEDLAEQLDEASNEPDTCTWRHGECSSYVAQGDRCARHGGER